jgi:hypothetical protein
MGLSSSNGPPLDDDDVSIVVPESFESDRLGFLTPALLFVFAIAWSG